LKVVVQQLKWPFNKDEVERHLTAIHRLQVQINLAYSRTTLALLEDVASTTAKTYSMIDNQEMRKMLDWLSPIDFASQQAQIFAKWCPGTIGWYLGTIEYQTWLEGGNHLLWTPGLAGMGKSVLVSFVIDSLGNSIATQSFPTLGIYFNSRTPAGESDFMSDILSSLLKQLLIRIGPDNQVRDQYWDSAIT
jgi:hypothetical protein